MHVVLKCFLGSFWGEKDPKTPNPKTLMAAGGHSGLCHGLQVGSISNCQNGFATWIQKLNQFSCFRRSFCIWFLHEKRNFGRIPSFHQKKASKFQEKNNNNNLPRPVSLTLPRTFCDFCYFWKFQSYQAARLRQSARSRRVALELLRVGSVRWHVWKCCHKYLNQYVVNPRNFRCMMYTKKMDGFWKGIPFQIYGPAIYFRYLYIYVRFQRLEHMYF